MRRLGALAAITVAIGCGPSAPAKTYETTTPIPGQALASGGEAPAARPPADASASRTMPTAPSSSRPAPDLRSSGPARGEGAAALALALFPNGLDLRLPRAAWLPEDERLIVAQGSLDQDGRLARLSLTLIGRNEDEIPVCGQGTCLQATLIDVEGALRARGFTGSFVELVALAPEDVKPETAREIAPLKGKIVVERRRVSLLRYGQAHLLFEGESKKGRTTEPIAIFVPPDGGYVTVVLGSHRGDLDNVWIRVAEVPEPGRRVAP